MSLTGRTRCATAGAWNINFKSLTADQREDCDRDGGDDDRDLDDDDDDRHNSVMVISDDKQDARQRDEYSAMLRWGSAK